MPQRFWICPIKGVRDEKLRVLLGENQNLPDRARVRPHSTLVRGSEPRQKACASVKLTLSPRRPEINGAITGCSASLPPSLTTEWRRGHPASTTGR